MIKLTFRNNEKGFTVVEAIIAAFIFSILAVTAAGIFFRAVDIQRRAFGAQKIQENTLFAVETIARDIRVSQVCSTATTCSTSVLELEHPLRGVIRYSRDAARGVIVKNEGGSSVDITSNEVNYTRFDFLVLGSNNGMGAGFSDCRQPRVSIISSVQNRVGRPLVVNFQTTVTSRDARQELLFPASPCP
jgi:hypothetical protein